MQGNSEQLTSYLEGSKVRFLIPVYQRKYEWKEENCLQLYRDLCKVSQENRPSHFFGSVVANVISNKGVFEHHVIDGQQRITTIMLLLLAMYRLLDEGKLVSSEENRKEEIYETYLISKFKHGDDRFRLVPVEADREAYHKLFGDPVDFDRSSNLTNNYYFFYNLLLKEEIAFDDLYDAINKLEIINITLEQGDNAQLIFESLNSTGIALEEGDKIRNYVLMGQAPAVQNQLFQDYWKKIEICTQDKVSDFVRDYLSIKQLSTPNLNNVYPAFKRYVSDQQLPINAVLEELLKYARYYKKLLTCKSELHSKQLDDCLYRLQRLEVTVVRPFFMEVLRLNDEHKLSTEDVEKVFLITETYLFRRNICEVPTNALNKIFVTLNKEIIRFDNSTDDYVNKFIYALESKKESGRFPNDEEFTNALANKQVYLMRGKYKNYLFERFENQGTVEVKDVYTLLDNNIYSIEHIMPRHLTTQWQEDLGSSYKEIHETWLNRLGNLTLTGYNPNLSNKSFIEKRDAKVGGYSTSGIRMNQKIASLDHWGPDDMEKRSKEMVERAADIWAYPETTFVPAEKEYETYSLDDEDVDLTGRDVLKYSYKNAEQPVNSWTDMMEQIVRTLHQQDKSVLTGIAYGSNGGFELGNFVANAPEKLRTPLEIDTNIFIEKNNSTAHKLTILRRLFALYHVDPLDLVFYLRDPEPESVAEEGRKFYRKKYWDMALPVIQAAHSDTGCFANCKPGVSNAVNGYFGISGFCITCTANYNYASIDLWLGSSNQFKNKQFFDYLYTHKTDVENKLGTALKWLRADGYRSSWITLRLENVGITSENDLPRIAKFHAEWSKKYYDVFVPLLKEKETSWKSIAQESRAAIIDNSMNWAAGKDGIRYEPEWSDNNFVRFRTDYMDSILPDIPGSKSGWKTENHYYYEIYSKRGGDLRIQLAFNSKGLDIKQRQMIEQIDKWYKGDGREGNWNWIISYKTKKYNLNQFTQEEISNILDNCFMEIQSFERDLQNKIEESDQN